MGLTTLTLLCCIQYQQYRADNVPDPYSGAAESQCNKDFTQHSSEKNQKNQAGKLLQYALVFI